MFCPKCGTAVADGAQFCPTCGTATAQAQPQQPQYAPQQPQYAPQQPQPEQPQQPYYAPQQPYYTPVAQAPAMAMGWYKFLIYFALFASAVLNAISAISMLTGAMYDGSAKLVYAFFDGLKTLDTLMGIGLLVLAALAIYTRFRLSGYRKNGPAMLNTVYLVVAGLQLMYIIGAYSILPEIVAKELDITSPIISIVVSVAMVAVNTTYFKKRKHLFVQ